MSTLWRIVRNTGVGLVVIACCLAGVLLLLSPLIVAAYWRAYAVEIALAICAVITLATAYQIGKEALFCCR